MTTLTQADAIASATLAHGRSLGSAPLTVAVLDAGGHLVVLKREDGSGILRPQIACAKAWSALGMGFSSREIGVRAERQPVFFGALAAVALALSSPSWPVAALALPELMMIPRIDPEGRIDRSQWTGAAATRLVVNVPAAEQSRSDTSAARSSPPEGLIPARTPEARKPWGRDRSVDSLMGNSQGRWKGLKPP